MGRGCRRVLLRCVTGAGEDEDKKTGSTGRSVIEAEKKDPRKFVK